MEWYPRKKIIGMRVSPDALVPHAETTAAAIDSVDVGGGAEAERADEDDDVVGARADAGNLGIWNTAVNMP